MSLVGPRPEQLELVERYSPEHRFRLDVKPGLTGPMQIHGRGELTFEERLAVELDYVENLSIGRDLRILALTPVSDRPRHRRLLSDPGRNRDRADGDAVPGGAAARLAGGPGAGFETIVVDNGTGAAELERAAARARRARPCCAWTRTSATPERSTWRQRRAQGDALVLLNDDSVVEPGLRRGASPARSTRPPGW